MNSLKKFLLIDVFYLMIYITTQKKALLENEKYIIKEEEANNIKLDKNYLSFSNYGNENIKVYQTNKAETYIEISNSTVKWNDIYKINSFVKSSKNENESTYYLCGEKRNKQPFLYKYETSSFKMSTISFPDFINFHSTEKNEEILCNYLELESKEQSKKLNKILILFFKYMNYIGFYDLSNEKWIELPNQNFGKYIIYLKLQKEVSNSNNGYNDNYIYLAYYLEKHQYKFDKIKISLSHQNSKISLKVIYSKKFFTPREFTLANVYYEVSSYSKYDTNIKESNQLDLYLISQSRVYKYSSSINNNNDFHLISSKQLPLNIYEYYDYSNMKLLDFNFLNDHSPLMYFNYKNTNKKHEGNYWGVIDIKNLKLIYESKEQIRNINSYLNDYFILISPLNSSYLSSSLLICLFNLEITKNELNEVLDYQCHLNSNKANLRLTQVSCYESCETCSKPGNSSKHYCLSCKSGYIQLGNNCYENCTNPYEGFNYNYECINCKDLNLVKSPDNPFCLDTSSITYPFFYVQESPQKDYNVIDYCFSNCASCTEKGTNYTSQKCTSCNSPLKLSRTGNCYTKCEGVNDTLIDNKCLLCVDFNPPRYLSFNPNYLYSKCFEDIPYNNYVKETDLISNRLSSYSQCDGVIQSGINRGKCLNGCYDGKYRYENNDGTISCLDYCDNRYYAQDNENLMCINCSRLNDTNYYLYKSSTCIAQPTRPYNTNVTYYNNFHEIMYCLDSCAACTKKDSQNCTECKDGYHIEEDKCVEFCQYGYAVDNATNICIHCEELGKYYLEGDQSHCYDSMPSNGFMTNYSENAFKFCHEACATCESLGTDLNSKCLKCKENYSTLERFENRKCFKECPNIFIKSYKDGYGSTCISCYDKYKFKFMDDLNCTYDRLTKPNNTYYLMENYGIIDWCGKTCKTCSIGPNATHDNCETCDDGLVLSYLEKKCAENCTALFPLDAGDNFTCYNCKDLNKYKFYEVNSVCFDKPTAPFYFIYEEFNVIGMCDEICESCYGPPYQKDNITIQNCKKCKWTYGLDENGTCVNCKSINKFLYKDTIRCIDEPNISYYFLNETTNYINKCKEECNSCNKYDYYCSNCSSGYYSVYRTSYFECTKECNRKYTIQDDNNTQCINCKEFGLYKLADENSEVCQPKPDGSKKYVIVMYDYNAFEYCHDLCQECYKAPTVEEPHNCKSCKEPYYLLGKYCKLTCPDFYAYDNVTRKCVNCKSLNQYRLEDELYECSFTTATKPINTYMINSMYNVIGYCGKSCQTCSRGPNLDDDGNTINDNCDSCPTGYHFVYSADYSNKTCVLCGYLYGLPIDDEDNNTCQLCPVRNDNLKYKFYEENTYCIERPSQDILPTYIYEEYEEYNVIGICHKNCKSCDKGPSTIGSTVIMNCLDCTDDYIQDNNTCNVICEDFNEGLDDVKGCINCRLINKVRYPHNKTCVNYPDNGILFINYNYSIVIDCDSICRKCQSNTSTCTACYDGYYLEYNANKCIRNCNYKFDNLSLLVSDDTENKCINCKDSYKYKYLNDTECTMDNLPENNYYFVSKRFNVIGKCDDVCDECYGAKNDKTTNCKKCKSGYFAQPDDPSNCLSDCPEIYYAKDDINNKCLNCKTRNKYKYPDLDYCVDTYPKKQCYISNENFNLIGKCHDSCETCSNGPSTDDLGNIIENCDSCIDGMYISYENKSCVFSCGELYGIADDGIHCEKCPERTDNKTYKYSNGLYCIERPDDDEQPTAIIDKDYGIIEDCYKGCVNCNQAPDLINNIHNCFGGCRNGYKSDDNTSCILMCSDNPLVYDELTDSCINCVDLGKVKYLKNNSCILERLIDFPYYYVTTNKDTVDDCYSTCASCTDKASSDLKIHNCITCKKGYYLDDTNCVKECSNPYMVKNNTSNECQNCKTLNKYYLDGKCVSNKKGYYIPENYQNYSVLFPCDSMCTDCEDYPDKCTACSPGKFSADDGKCYDSCNKILYVEDSVEHKCINCKTLGKFKIFYDDKCIDEPLNVSHPMIFSDYNVIDICTTCDYYYYDYNHPDYSNDTNLKCQDGFYLQPCDSIKNNDSNISCDEFICSENCPENYAINNTNNTCINCKDSNKYKCKECDKCINYIPDGSSLVNNEFNILENCSINCDDIKDNDDTIINDYLNSLNVNLESCKKVLNGLNYNTIDLNTNDNNKDINSVDLVPTYNIFDNISSLNELELKVYTNNGTRIMSSYCDSAGDVLVTFPLNDSYVKQKDLEAIKDLMSKGVNVTDLNDEFYNDFCHQFESTNTIPFSLRKQILSLYESDLCGGNQCKLNNLNTQDNVATCTCNEDSLNSNNDCTNDDDKKNAKTNIKNTNLYVIRCLKLVFDTQRLAVNKGSYIVGFLTIVQAVNIIFYAAIGVNSLNKTIFSILENKNLNNPPIKKGRGGYNINEQNTIFTNTGVNSIPNANQANIYNNDNNYNNNYNYNNNPLINNPIRNMILNYMENADNKIDSASSSDSQSDSGSSSGSESSSGSYSGSKSGSNSESWSERNSYKKLNNNNQNCNNQSSLNQSNEINNDINKQPKSSEESQSIDKSQKHCKTEKHNKSVHDKKKKKKKEDKKKKRSNELKENAESNNSISKMNSSNIMDINNNLDNKKMDVIINNLRIQSYEYKYLSFDDLVKYDHRKFYEILYDNICDKFIIFFFFFKKNDICLKNAKLGIVVLTLSLHLAVNALIFKEDFILQKFNYGSVSFSSTLPNALISSLFSFIIFSILKFIISFERPFVNMKLRYNTHADNLKNLLKLYKKINIITVILFIIIMIILVPLWYYIAAFFTVFSSYAGIWLHVSFEGLNLLYIIQFFFAFIQSIFDYLTVHCRSKCCCVFSSIFSIL